MPRIFERFYRVSNSRGKQAIEGSRLGLAIVKHIVQFYGYSIEVHSTLGSGTRPVVSLKQKNQ